MCATGVFAAITQVHSMPDGAEWINNAQVRFRFWAPSQPAIRLSLDEVCEIAMASPGDGCHEVISNSAHAGSRYRFLLPDGSSVPDPASRFQREDVRGPSEVIDPAAYYWSDERWTGRPWREAVIYEMHVGAFTEEGTFLAAAGKLEHLASLGVTAIELMPIADFAGRWKWGYDGVLPYAPDSKLWPPGSKHRSLHAQACGPASVPL